MKFRSLKFISVSIIAVAVSFFMMACSDESGKNSSTVPANGADSSGAANMGSADAMQHDTTTIRKRRGSVSAFMVTETDATAKMEKDKMGYYNRTEVLPAYDGGQGALENYITNNLVYPQDAIDNNIEGTVKVQFAVDEQGIISNVKTISDKVGYGLEEEAVKIVSKMPKWTPGQIKGKNVKTWRILPITYKLES